MSDRTLEQTIYDAFEACEGPVISMADIAAALIAAGWTPPEPWQPIETAPKGQWVLMVTDAPAYLVRRTGWAHHNAPDAVTHWRPLPTPPKEAGQ